MMYWEVKSAKEVEAMMATLDKISDKIIAKIFKRKKVKINESEVA